jgi:hypothetical protein
MCASQKVILHCHGARAYRFTKMPGVVIDRVKNQRPNPIYSAKFMHKLPKDHMKTHLKLKDQGPLENGWVKTGTQMIDNVSKSLRVQIPNAI